MMGMKEGKGKGRNSISSYLVNAFVEWFLILMLLLNSIFTYLIFRFAHRFRLKKPCLCCSSSALISSNYTDLLCHHHATHIASSSSSTLQHPRNKLPLQPILLRNSISSNTTFKQNLTTAYSSIDEKTILEGTSPDQQHHDVSSSFRDFVDDADNNKSTLLITHLYSDDNVVEFDFTEDEYDVKDIVHDHGYRLVGREGFTWRCALPEAQPLMIGGTTCCLGESTVQTHDTLMIKHKKVNEDESYSIAYTAEGDLVMDLCRNLASAKSIATASHTVDAIPPNKATPEQQSDQISLQAHGKILALQNIENAERRIELDREDQPSEKSSDILTQSCLQYSTFENVHKKIDQMARSVCPSPPLRNEELVCEQVQGTSVPASVDLSLEHAIERNMEDLPHALRKLPMTTCLEEISEMQVERYQEKAPALPFPLAAEDHSDFCQIDNQGSDLVGKKGSFSVKETQSPQTSSLGLIKNEEDKLLDTPLSFNGADNHYSNWLLFEKRESATEETFDGSINSDFEYGEGISTVDKLKTALRVERKALHALYAELEEERNASAVAACQTMAMINRLQEEKASIQMEALQYQRMMEEQSEYDQEALQHLNELMVKREREKQELEKELEIYRKRVIDYETKETLLMLNRKDESLRRGSSSVSCSNSKAEDSYGVSNDLKVDMKNMDGFERKEEKGINSTPFDDVLHMEEERLSLLEQFRVLEEKIFTLDSENDGFPFNHDHSCITNGTENGCHDDVKGHCHQERRITGPKAKTLLPQFDATIDGDENTELSRNENRHDFTSYPHSSAYIYEAEDIEEEIDQVYERLQSLEADNKFLRHCFGSLNRGDKGLELLQEILQHLCNLRTVELEARK